MSFEQEIFQINVRSSLNLIYTMSRMLATMMNMDDTAAAQLMQASTDMILQEACELYRCVREDYLAIQQRRPV